MSIFRVCLSDNPKYVLRIGILLKTNFRSLATYFKFGVGDRLPACILQQSIDSTCQIVSEFFGPFGTSR